MHEPNKQLNLPERSMSHHLHNKPELSKELMVTDNFLISPLCYARKNRENTSYYIFEVVGYRGEIEDSGLPVVKNDVKLSRTLNKQQFTEEFS